MKLPDCDVWGLATPWQHSNISTLLHRFLKFWTILNPLGLPLRISFTHSYCAKFTLALSFGNPLPLGRFRNSSFRFESYYIPRCCGVCYQQRGSCLRDCRLQHSQPEQMQHSECSSCLVILVLSRNLKQIGILDQNMQFDHSSFSIYPRLQHISYSSFRGFFLGDMI